MSLRMFLYAADALRLEDGVSFHVETGPPAGLTMPSVPSPADVRQQNANAMQTLMGITAGISKKGRRG